MLFLSWIIPLGLLLIVFFLAQKGLIPTFNLGHNKGNYLGGSSQRLAIIQENLSCLAVYLWISFSSILLVFLAFPIWRKTRWKKVQWQNAKIDSLVYKVDTVESLYVQRKYTIYNDSIMLTNYKSQVEYEKKYKKYEDRLPPSSNEMKTRTSIDNEINQIDVSQWTKSQKKSKQDESLNCKISR
mgnify:CR=1 FL=1